MSSEISPIDWRQPNWYALFVRSNQEKRVAQGLNDRGIEHFLPCYSSVRQWKDRRVRLDMPLFPGYLFLRLSLAERIRALTVPNVISLVGRMDSPAVISPEEIDWIRAGTAHGHAEPHEYLKAGQRVVITDGILSGMQGILLRMSNGMRVVVSLESIARAFAVEVDAAVIKVIAAGALEYPGHRGTGPAVRGVPSSRARIQSKHPEDNAAVLKACG